MDTTENTISVHLPVGAAESILTQMDWHYDEIRSQWISPNDDAFWCVDEALTVALTCYAATA